MLLETETRRRPIHPETFVNLLSSLAGQNKSSFNCASNGWWTVIMIRFRPTRPGEGQRPNAEEAQAIFRLGYLIAGGEEVYWARPFITYGCCPVISPLTMDMNATGMVMHFTEERLPNYSVITPIINGGIILADAPPRHTRSYGSAGRTRPA